MSPARHLSQTVPKLAVSDNLLYHACLAYGSTILALRGEVSNERKDHYHSKVISMLLDCLSSNSHPENMDTVIASTVLLRMSEQFTELSEDKRRHLSGAFCLLTLRGEAQKWSTAQTDLGGVSFWIYIQETIRLCFLNGEKCQFDMKLIDENHTYAPTRNAAWTNRTTYLLVEACYLCFGTDEETDSPELALQLGHHLDRWKNNVPSSFLPWSYRDREHGPFPGIYFLSTWHGTQVSSYSCIFSTNTL